MTQVLICVHEIILNKIINSNKIRSIVTYYTVVIVHINEKNLITYCVLFNGTIKLTD